MDDNPFSEFLRQMGVDLPSQYRHPFVPAMDIALIGGALIVKLDVPGMTSENIQVEAKGHYLVISGERQNDFMIEGVQMAMHERAHSPFQREIPLPAETLRDEIEARTLNGVLTITIPLDIEPEPEGQEIPIQDG